MLRTSLRSRWGDLGGGARLVTAAVRGSCSSERALPIAAVATAALLWLPGFWRQGFPMDEGQLLAYPDWMGGGAVPHRDFESSYGPGMLWVLAGLFRGIGPSVGAERLVGLLFRLLIVAAVHRLAAALSPPPPAARARRPAWTAAAAAWVAVALLVPSGLYAFAWFGGLACLLWSLQALVRATERSAGAPALAAVAGALAAAGLWFRLDLCLAVGLSALPLWLLATGRDRVSYLAGALAGLLPLGAHLARLGTAQAWRSLFVEPVLLAAPGRRLPIPPQTAADRFFFALAVLGAGLLLVVAASRYAAAGPRARGRTWMALSALGLGTLPQLFQRADAWHAIDVACFTLPLLVVPLADAGFVRRPWLRHALRATTAAVAAIAAAVGVAQAAGPVRAVRVADRQFPLDPAVAADLQPVLRVLDAVAAAGERLFVGPRDLRRSNYGDTFIYFLLPRLAPASYFTEMNPGVASAPGSSLARDLERADFLVLTRRFDDWHERNRSTLFGSPAPARVVAQRFCLLAVSGSFELFERCDHQRLAGSAHEP